MPPDSLPVTIDRRYELHEALGAGGMGVVYCATDRLTGKPVALKQVTIPASQLMFASRGGGSDLSLALAQEFQNLASPRHPNIVSVYEFGFDEQRRPYFTMEYLPGGKSVFDAGRGRTPDRKVDLILQMLQALVYLHRRGILHRDLKPANALVFNGQLKLLDFGLSVATSRTVEHLTETTTGTMAYMAPEIFKGAPYSRSSDLYALGLIAFELVTGHFPFNDSNMATLLNDVLTKQVSAGKSGVSVGLAAVLDRLLAKTREERYGDAAEVIRELCAAATLPLPPETGEIRGSFLQAARFVGREEELARLDDALTAAEHGQGTASRYLTFAICKT